MFEAFLAIAFPMNKERTQPLFGYVFGICVFVRD